jgi:threonine dehydratase
VDPTLLREARERIAPYLSPTPLVDAHALSRRTGVRARLKLESLQPTGSFKVRPAFNGLLSRLPEAQARGVLCSSSGNFAQAVAFAARELGVSATIVMSSATSKFKVERTRALGAEVVSCGPRFEDRWETTRRLQEETGRLLLHPFDSPETVAGDATIGLELLDQLPGGVTVAVPVSGGGMLAGVACALRAARPGCRIIGVQPRANASMARSLAAGERVNVGAFTTVADALVAAMPGELTFSLARKLVDDLVLVDEEEILAAVRFLAEEQKLVAEPGGAVAVAALLAGRLPGREAVCVISGGNVRLGELFR